MDLSLQNSGPFFVRAVLPNLPNPPGYRPDFKDMFLVSASKTMKSMKVLGCMVCNSYSCINNLTYSYMDYLIGTKTFDCQTYAE